MLRDGQEVLPQDSIGTAVQEINDKVVDSGEIETVRDEEENRVGFVDEDLLNGRVRAGGSGLLLIGGITIMAMAFVVLLIILLERGADLPDVPTTSPAPSSTTTMATPSPSGSAL